jgi:O-antigen/teichoic acid export membrane protein
MSILNLPSFEAVLRRVAAVKREIIFLGLGQGFSLLGGIAGIKLLTGSLVPEEYGLLALSNSIAGFLVMFLFGPMSAVVARFFPVFREKKELPTFFRLVGTLLGKLILLVVLCALPLSLFCRWQWSGSWTLLLIMSLIYGVSVGLLASFQNIHNALRHRGVVAFHQAADAWMRPMAAMALIWGWGASGLRGILGFTLGSLAINVSQVFCLARLPEVRENLNGPVADAAECGRIRSEFWAYFHPFIFFSISGWIVTFADRWFLQLFYGSREVGLYSAVAQVAGIPILMIGSISQFMMPILFERAGNMDSPERMDRTNRLLRLIILFSTVLMTGVFLVSWGFGERIMALLTSRDYSGSGTLLWALILAQSFGQIANLLTFKGLYFNQAGGYILPRLVQAMVFILLTIPLLPRMGIYGIVTSLNISSVILVILIWRKNRQMTLPGVSVAVPAEVVAP